jgi:acyl dehydratase
MPKEAYKDLYFDDLPLGFKFSIPGRTIFEADIVGFVAISGQAEPLFLNSEYAEKESIFKRRVAPGMLVWQLSMMGMLRLGILEKAGLAFLGLDDVNFLKPVYPGDTIYSEAEIIERKETSKGDRGIIAMKFEVKNQRGEKVMEYTHRELLRKRPPS